MQREPGWKTGVPRRSRHRQEETGLISIEHTHVLTCATLGDIIY